MSTQKANLGNGGGAVIRAISENTAQQIAVAEENWKFRCIAAVKGWTKVPGALARTSRVSAIAVQPQRELARLVPFSSITLDDPCHTEISGLGALSRSAGKLRTYVAFYQDNLFGEPVLGPDFLHRFRQLLQDANLVREFVAALPVNFETWGVSWELMCADPGLRKKAACLLGSHLYNRACLSLIYTTRRIPSHDEILQALKPAGRIAVEVANGAELEQEDLLAAGRAIGHFDQLEVDPWFRDRPTKDKTPHVADVKSRVEDLWWDQIQSVDWNKPSLFAKFLPALTPAAEVAPEEEFRM